MASAPRIGKLRVMIAVKPVIFAAIILLINSNIAEGRTRCWCNTRPPTNTLSTKDATFSCCKNQNDKGFSGASCDVTVMSFLSNSGLASGTHACAAFDGNLNEGIFSACCSGYGLDYICDDSTEKTCKCAGSPSCKYFPSSDSMS
jgi:hypothetical protein